ncbi:MAG: serine/threonine protein kinase [Kofleriaceae bacterium]
MNALLARASINEPAELFLRSVGEVFAVFNERTQDSGNVSYGVRAGERRFFVKTAGRVDDPVPVLSHQARVELLRNAAEVARVLHPSVPRLHRVIESTAGPMLVYDWFDGELLNARRADRDDPASAFQRFRALPVERIVTCLDTIFDLHVVLARAGWIAGDFYDGCLLYDFTSSELRIIDLDTYHRGPHANTMGRMFGSTRFMAPEEFTLGATVDERTTVFNLGRAAFVFLGEPGASRGSPTRLAAAARGCEPTPERRFATVADLVAAWRA